MSRHGVQIAFVLVQAATLLALVLLGRQFVRGWKRADWLEKIGILGLFVFALVLRLAAPWSTFDLNVRHFAAFDPNVAPDWLYGLSVEALMRVVYRVVPGFNPYLHSVFDTMAVASALAVVALVLWLRDVALPPLVAWLAGLWWAIDPATVRFAHTDAQPILESLWTLGALLAGARWVREDRAEDALALGLMGGLVALCRPESLAIPVWIAVLVLADRAPVGLRRLSWAIAPFALLWSMQFVRMVAVVIPAAPSHAGVPWDDLGQHPLFVHGFRHVLALDPAWTSPVLSLVMLASFRCTRKALRWRLAVLGVAGFMLLMVGGDTLWTPSGMVRPGFARHQLRIMPFSSVLIALGFCTLFDRFPKAKALWALLAVAGCAGQLARERVLNEPRTAFAEYRFLARHMPEIPEGCVVVHANYRNDYGLRPSAGLMSVYHQTWIPREAVVPPQADCVLWYRTSECSAVEEGPFASMEGPLHCEAYERAHHLTPLVTERLPSKPWIFDLYQDDVVVGFYRIDDVIDGRGEPTPTPPVTDAPSGEQTP